MTWPEHHLAVHALTVRSEGGIDAGLWEQVGARLQASAETPVRMLFRPSGRARVTTTGAGTSTSIVRVNAPDDIGLLSATCRWFADHGISIEAAGIDTANGIANDVFLIDGDCDTSQLAAHLSRAPDAIDASACDCSASCSTPAEPARRTMRPPLARPPVACRHTSATL